MADLREKLRARPDHTAARLMLADRLAARGEIDLALLEYRVVVRAYVEQDAHEQAIRLLGKMIDLDPRRTDLAEWSARLSAVETSLPRRDIQIGYLARRPVEALEPSSLLASDLRLCWNDIAAAPFVRHLSDESMRLLFAACEVQQISPMTSLARRGQTHSRAYLLAAGVIDATRIAPGGGRLGLMRFVPGELFGDRALLDRVPWSADFRTSARRTTTVLRLTRERLEDLAECAEQVDGLYRAIRAHGRDRELETIVDPPGC